MQLQPIKPESISKLDTLAIAVRDGVMGDKAPFSEVLGLAVAVVGLRDALSDEVMRSVMALQGRPIGFLTDRDKNGGYPVDVVRDVTIEAMTHGARMVGNELNIIASRCYLTKAYFQRKLDEAVGSGNWHFRHGLPEVSEKEGKEPGKKIITATVETAVRWRINGEWCQQELIHQIKGDAFATADSYLGKADRKCGSWLYQRVTGRVAPDGDASDAIDVVAKAVSLPAAESQKSPMESPRTTTVATASAQAAADSAPVASTTAEQAQKPRMSAPERAKIYREVVMEVGATAMNTYLQKIGWITAEQSYRDLTDVQQDRVVGGREKFVEQAKASATGGK